MATPTGWTAQQLAEFVAAVSSAGDEQDAVRVAVERAAEAFAAEVAAILGAGEVLASTGVGISAVPAAELIRVAAGERDELAVPGIGPCAALVTPIDDDLLEALVLARRDDQGFSSE